MHLLAHDGMLPGYEPPKDGNTISPRRRGVKQGAMLILLGALIVPVFGVMSGFAPGRLENVFVFFAALSAIIFFLGGTLRMLFAAIFEEGAKQYHFPPPSAYHASAIPPARVSALPPPPANPASQWRQRPQTAEIVTPPSVTDGTTRLLDKEPKNE